MAATAPGAGAQEPGVVYEPGSPSYKEYSIPLEEVRRDAGGGIPNSIESRAFGIGLSRRGGGGPGSGPDDAARDGFGRSADGGREPARRGDRAATGDGAGPGDLRRQIADAEAAGAPFLWELAPLLLVLLPALLVGLLLARRGTEQRPAT
jgi:hypothetical protein